MSKTLMFRVGESESEELDRRVEEELKSITNMLLGWPNLMISFQKSIQELTLAGKIDKNTADEAIKVVTTLFARLPEIQKTLGDYATILAAHQTVRTTKQMARFTKWLAVSTTILALATLVLALTSLFHR